MEARKLHPTYLPQIIRPQESPVYQHLDAELIFDLFFENFQQGFCCTCNYIKNALTEIQCQPDIVADNTVSEWYHMSLVTGCCRKWSPSSHHRDPLTIGKYYKTVH